MIPIETLTNPGAIHWGVILAQGWKGELAETGRQDAWLVARDWAQKAEQLGFARWRQDEKRGMSASEVGAYIRNRGALYGTASAIEEKIQSFIDAGCGGFMVFCNEAPAAYSLEQFSALPSVMDDRNILPIKNTGKAVDPCYGE
jgi:alkanesulfonate monooxygenase SsuD/methylene tetrahydromethanopterin reductase-like flavin-dependent oxidoreductase (luciferase family)